MSITTLSGTLRRDREYIGDVIALETDSAGRYFILSDGSRQDTSQAGLEFRPEPTPVKADPGWYLRVEYCNGSEERLTIAAWLYTATGYGDALIIRRDGRPTRASQLPYTDPSIFHIGLHHAEHRPEPPNDQPSPDYIIRRALSDGNWHDPGEIAEQLMAAGHDPDEVPLANIAQQLGAESAEAQWRLLRNGASW